MKIGKKIDCTYFEKKLKRFSSTKEKIELLFLIWSLLWLKYYMKLTSMGHTLNA